MKRVINQTKNQILVDDLELAKTFNQRLLGLMGRPSLAKGKGLLIKGSGNSIHTFFMRFAIDLVFINKKGVVKYAVSGMKPWRVMIAPLLSRTDCLELPAGVIAKTDTRKGDILHVEA